jgi:hypothetical protein
MVAGAGVATSVFAPAGDLPGLAGAGLGLLVGCCLLKLYDARSLQADWQAQNSNAGAAPQVCFKES